MTSKYRFWIIALLGTAGLSLLVNHWFVFESRSALAAGADAKFILHSGELYLAPKKTNVIKWVSADGTDVWIHFKGTSPCDQGVDFKNKCTVNTKKGTYR